MERKGNEKTDKRNRNKEWEKRNRKRLTNESSNNMTDIFGRRE